MIRMIQIDDSTGCEDVVKDSSSVQQKDEELPECRSTMKSDQENLVLFDFKKLL